MCNLTCIKNIYWAEYLLKYINHMAFRILIENGYWQENKREGKQMEEKGSVKELATKGTIMKGYVDPFVGFVGLLFFLITFVSLLVLINLFRKMLF